MFITVFWILLSNIKAISFPGITAFLRSISVEAIGLGVHLAAGAHDILVQAEYKFTNSAPSIPRPVSSKTKANVRSNQPKDAQQGIQQVNIPKITIVTLCSFSLSVFSVYKH